MLLKSLCCVKGNSIESDYKSIIMEPQLPPPVNNLVTPLHTDLYQLTMAYGYWKTNRHNEDSVFELFFRKSPFKGTYTIFCGIDEVLKFVSNFRFTAEDIAYLKTIPSMAHCEPEFFEYLSNLDCSEVKIESIPMGSVVFPRVPLVIVSGPIVIAQLLETTLLNLINFPSLVATNASRMVIAARGQNNDIKVYGKIPKCVEFGLRRAQGPDGAFSASKYCMVGGFDSIANVQAGKLLNLPVGGTHAHSFVMSFNALDDLKNSPNVVKKGNEMIDLVKLSLKYREELDYMDTNEGELAAFLAYAIAFPNTFLCLIDTYDTLESGIKNFIAVALALIDCGYKPIGVRLDSGDLGALSLDCHEVFHGIADKYNLDIFRQMDVVASSDINEALLLEMKEKGHGITMFGIGTNLVTCQAQPALGGVFKLTELNGIPRIKLSADIAKVLLPGRKRAFRFFDEKYRPFMDYLMEAKDEVPMAGKEVCVFDPFTKNKGRRFVPTLVKEILQTVWDGKRGVTVAQPTLMEARETCIKAIQSLDPDMVKAKDPKKYDVCVSNTLYTDLHALWESSKHE